MATQILLVATGQLPLVIADPTLAGPAAILYPPSSKGNFTTNPVNPLSMTSPNGTNYVFCT